MINPDLKGFMESWEIERNDKAVWRESRKSGDMEF